MADQVYKPCIELEKHALIFPNAWIRWAIPATVVGGLYAAYYFFPSFYFMVMNPHGGILESVHGIVLLTALLISCKLFFALPTREKTLKYWVLAFSIGVFYFLGEDMDWGQYYFNWDVPRFFLEHNKEHETNLHNISPWFNQKPRILVELWVLVAGVLVPLGWKWPKQVTKVVVPSILWPGSDSVLVGMLAIMVVLPYHFRNLVADSLGVLPWPSPRVRELQEFCFGWFMMLYIWSLQIRVRRELKSSNA